MSAKLTTSMPEILSELKRAASVVAPGAAALAAKVAPGVARLAIKAAPEVAAVAAGVAVLGLVYSEATQPAVVAGGSSDQAQGKAGDSAGESTAPVQESGKSDKQRNGTPGNNQEQNKQFQDATRGLSKEQKRRVHDEISGENMSYKEIRDLVKEMFGK